ncbi:MAG: DUF3592 domain-containing protein [Phycisphaerales bacterium]
MKKRSSGRFVLMGVGILLVLLGVQAIVVKFAGTTTQGMVTDVKQVVSESSDKMDCNYEICYRFSVNGRDYSGSLSRKRVYNVAMLPAEGSAITVRYLAAAPFLNGPADASPLMGVALGGLGVFLVVVGLRINRHPAPEPVAVQDPSAA